MEFRATGPFHILTLIKDETRRRNVQLSPQSTFDRHQPHFALPNPTWAASEDCWNDSRQTEAASIVSYRAGGLQASWGSNSALASCKFPEAQVKSWTLTQRKKNSVWPPRVGQWNTFSDKPIHETQQASRDSDNGSNSLVSLLTLLNLDLNPIWTKNTREFRLNLDSFIGTVYLTSLCKHSDRMLQIETYLSTF